MKAGDLIRVIGSHAQIVGTIIKPWKVEEGWVILTQRGELIHWPESQMEIINEGR